MRILQYTLLAYGISWTFMLLFVFSSRGFIELPQEILSLLGPIATFGPLAAALIMTYRAGQTRQFLKRAVTIRFPWYFWIIALLIWPLIQGLGFLSAIGYGGIEIQPEMYLSLAVLLPLFLQTLVIGGPLGEEFGWRGYALPILLERHGPVASSLILGFIHAFWHLPIWFVIGEGGRDMPFWLFAVNVVSQTPIYTWLYLRSNGSAWPVILFHTTQNIVFFNVFNIPNGLPAFGIVFYIAVIACVVSLVRQKASPRGDELAEDILDPVEVVDDAPQTATLLDPGAPRL
jgi:membrane protease YdiL (CAAX protease family)